MTVSNIDLEFLAKQSARIIEELRATRKEVADIRTLTLQTYEFSRRVEKRDADLRDDLEIAIKMEFGGGFAHLQTSVEAMIDKLHDKIDDLSQRISVLEA